MLQKDVPFDGINADGQISFTNYSNGRLLDGPETIHTIEWAGGPMKASLSDGFLDLGGNLDLHLLGSCDPNDVIAGGVTTSNVSGSFYGFDQDVPAGTYYLVVDGFGTQKTDYYTLLVEDGTEVQPEDPCDNIQPIQVDVPFSFSNAGGTSEFSTYNNGVVPGQGPEIVHSINWPGGEMKATLVAGNPDLGTDLDLILLGSCEPNNYINGSFEGGTAESITQDLPAGTYYLVADGFEVTDINNYILTVESPLQPDPCDNLVPLTINQEYMGTNANGTSVFTTYGNNKVLEGPEIVHSFNWPGGDMKATLSPGDNTIGGELDIMLLGSCDPSDFLASNPLGGLNEEILVANLAAGTYFLVVDGFDDVNNVDFYKLLVEEVEQEDFCGDRDNVSTELQCGVTVSLTPNVSDLDAHCGQEGYTGPERIYEIDWTGGRFIATLEEKNPGQELILYRSCDPNDCVTIEPNQIDINLSTGTYYLVVDGKDGASGRYTLSLTNPDNPDCILPDFKLLTFEGDDCVQPGDNLTYTATVGNDGDRAFTQEELAEAIDRVYLTANPDPADFENWVKLAEAPSKQVAPGGSYSTSFNLIIPDNTAPGDYFLIFWADDDFKVTEAFAGGNTSVNPISVGNSTGPDYVPSNLQAPSAANPEEDIQIKVTLANEGNANGSASGGKDKIFLNTRDNLTEGSPVELLPTTNLPTRDLSANQQLTITRTVQIPANTAAGDYFLIFHMDADNVVDECNDQNNTVSTAIKIRIGNPDYVPQDFVVDGKTELTVKQGQSLSGSVEIKNQGNGPGTRFTDGKYYYSTNASFNPNADILLGNNRDSIEPLGAGEKRTEGETVKLPNSVPTGPGYILYVVDVPNKVKESNEQNNVAFVRINVEARPNPGSGTGSGFEANFTVDDTRPCKGTEVTFTPNLISRILPDQGPNGLDGILRDFDSPSTASQNGFGNALKFGVNRDYVIMPEDITNGLQSLTFETWWYHVTSDNWQWPANLWSGSGSYINVGISPGGSLQLYFKKDASTERIFRSASIRVNADQWSHIAVVFEDDGSQLVGRVFINGAAALTVELNAKLSDLGSLTSNYLGRSSFFSGNTVEGSLMDEVRFWSTARTAEEINENKDKELDGNEEGILLYYDMNQPLASGDASYNWSFPGGTPSSSTEAIPTVTYAQAGSYDVSLSITADGQSDTESKSEFMNVQSCDPNELDADFIVDNSNPCEGEEIMFTNTTTGISEEATDLFDFSPNKNHGSLENFTAPFVDRENFGKVLEFDGNDDFVDLPDGLLEGVRSFTFETWYFHKENREQARLFDFGSSSTDWMIFMPLERTTKRPRVIMRSTDRQELEVTEALQLNQWYHMAFVLDANGSQNNARVYINGELRGQATFTFYPEDMGNFQDMWLGNSQFRTLGSDPLLIGSLDEIRLWNTARSQAEIQANKDQELIGNEAGLIAYYNANGQNALYSWTFPGGTPATSSEENPKVSFTEAGRYQVSLTVTQNGVSNTTKSNIKVEVCNDEVEPDWPVTPTGENHTIIVRNDIPVNVDGQTLEAGDYLGVFFKNGEEEICGGKVKWTGENTSVAAFGDDVTERGKNGFNAGESFSWRIWKRATETEYAVNATYEPTNFLYTHQGEYANDGISGLTSLSDGLSETQTLTLTPEWNMISSYIKPGNPDVAGIFSSIASSISLVKDEDGKAYVPSFGINLIGEWDIRKGYKLRNTSGTDLALSISGGKADPTTAIPLKEGWGIMSYLLEDPVNVATAMSEVSTQTIIVKDILGKAYFPSVGANTLGNMVAGQGYQVKMREESQLFYAAPNTNSLPVIEQPTDKNRPSQSIRSIEGPDWEVTHTGENHTLIISPGLTGTFNGQNLQVGDYVGVFYERDGRLVSGGKARWTGGNIALAAFANDPTTEVKDGFAEGETFTWKIWREADGHEETVAADYMDLDRVISHTDRFTFDGVSGVGLQQTLATSLSDFQIEGIKLYPNPSNGTFWLELPTDLTDMKLNVFNYTGQLVIQAQDIPAGKSMIELNNQPEGVYILQLVGSQQTLTDRIVLRR
ncbi:MAG: LamG-like jellyroll fold domain-containing protein [Bacteroidota bacterium]